MAESDDEIKVVVTVHKGNGKSKNDDPQKSFWQLVISFIVKLLGLSK